MGQDVDVVAGLITGVVTPDKKSFLAEIPGKYGDASADAPNAILVRKRFLQVLNKESDGTWSGLGLMIYRSNNPFGGGPRPGSAYARNLIDLSLPVYQQRVTHDENGDGTSWVLSRPVIKRPFAQKVITKTVDELNLDLLTEKIDPFVGGLCQFQAKGQLYRFIGGDILWAPGTPKRVEYRFQTTGAVPEFGVQSQFKNDIDIPALPVLGEYSTVEPADGNPPVVGVVDATTIYKQFDPFILPGF